MGISVNEGENDQTLYLWMPLTLVQDSVGAWDGSPGAARCSTGPIRARAVWAMRNRCDCSGRCKRWSTQCDTSGLAARGDYDAYCANTDHWVTHTSFIQTYEDSFFVTGLTVREDHGGAVAMVTQPRNVGNSHYEDQLWRLASNLQTAFFGAETKAIAAAFR